MGRLEDRHNTMATWRIWAEVGRPHMLEIHYYNYFTVCRARLLRALQHKQAMSPCMATFLHLPSRNPADSKPTSDYVRRQSNAIGSRNTPAFMPGSICIGIAVFVPGCTNVTQAAGSPLLGRNHPQGTVLCRQQSSRAHVPASSASPRIRAKPWSRTMASTRLKPSPLPGALRVSATR